MNKVFALVFISLFLCLVAKGQDPQFTQFYAAPMYHNPAFTGSAYAPRVMMNYRNQWPSLNANFITTLFTADMFLQNANSGVGVMFLNDKQGYNLSNTEVRLLYSYELKINPDNGIRFGLNGGYAFRGLESNGLIFGDQLDNNGLTGRPSNDPLSKSNLKNVNSLDVGSGVLYFNPNYFLGVAVNHITEPKMSFFKQPVGEIPRLPRLFIINGGLNINLDHLITDSYSEREFKVTPTFLIKKQKQFFQLDLGAYATYTPFTVGVQYRGIPLNKVFSPFPNQDAIAGMIGVRNENFSIGYSYDLTISGLGASSGGSHEISVAYTLPEIEMDRPARSKFRKKALACPKF